MCSPGCCYNLCTWTALSLDQSGLEEQLKSANFIRSANSSERSRKIQLYNRHGFNLAIFPSGDVRGVRHAFNPYAVLQITGVGVGEVRILGVESGHYLAMNSRGKLEGVKEGTGDETIFIEKPLENLHIAYLSRKFSYQGWHVGIKKDGGVKSGPNTWHPWGQLAISFLHRQAYQEPHPLKQIVNRHGYRLAILASGQVAGVTEESSSMAILEITPGPEPNSVRLRGVESSLYLSIDSSGRLYGESELTNQGTVFIQLTANNSHNLVSFLSARFSHLGWLVGITKSGKPKPAKKTVFPLKQKAVEWRTVQANPSPTNIDFDPSWTSFAFIDDDIDGEDIADDEDDVEVKE